jgi:hypothetical protein
MSDSEDKATDPVLSLVEAARYCGITRQGVEAGLRAAGIPFEELRVVGSKRGPRVIRGVHKSTLDAFQAHGFLIPRRGRRPNAPYHNKPRRTRRKNIVV